MIPKDVVNAMQILKHAQQLDPYRVHLDKLNDAIVEMDDELEQLIQKKIQLSKIIEGHVEHGEKQLRQIKSWMKRK